VRAGRIPFEDESAPRGTLDAAARQFRSRWWPRPAVASCRHRATCASGHAPVAGLRRIAKSRRVNSWGRNAGCIALGQDGEAVAFYEHHGFITLSADTRQLVLPLANLREGLAKKRILRGPRPLPR